MAESERRTVRRVGEDVARGRNSPFVRRSSTGEVLEERIKETNQDAIDGGNDTLGAEIE